MARAGPLSLLISLAAFTKIFRTLRHLQAQVQDRIQQQLSQPNALNTARYGKAVHSGYSQFWLFVIHHNILWKSKSLIVKHIHHT